MIGCPGSLHPCMQIIVPGHLAPSTQLNMLPSTSNHFETLKHLLCHRLDVVDKIKFGELLKMNGLNFKINISNV